MEKKKFKVIISKDDNTKVLKEVKGYFIWINDLRAFIYHDELWKKWYVIDLETGLSFSKGISMSKAKIEAFHNLDKLKKLKDREYYKNCRFLYQKLLKEEKNEC